MFRKSSTKHATDFEPSTEVFPPIAVGPIARKLKLEQRGSADGHKNYPTSDAVDLTTAEQEAISEITRLRKRGMDAFEIDFNAYQGRIDLGQSAVSQIDVQAGKLRNEMVSTSKIQQNTATNRLRAVKEFDNGLKYYRDFHRVAAPPKDAQSLWTVAFLIFLFFSIEIILGALFFQEHSPGGLVGSATYAIMISLVNVAISGLLGHFSRYMSLNGFGHKLLGCLSVASFLAFAIAFNVFVGHYRKATDEMPWEQAAYVMYDSFRAAPFELGSFNAILIVVFGIVVSVFAFLKVRGWEDVRPGYNRAYDSLYNAIDDYAEAYQETEESLNELFEASRSALLAEAHQLRGVIRSAANAHDGQKTLVNNLDAFHEECGQVANMLLRTYREANEHARATAPPQYFSEPFSFPAYPKRSVSEFAVDRIDREIKLINEAADRGVREILEARRQQLDTLPTTDAVLLSLDQNAVASTQAVKVDSVTVGHN